MPPPYSRATHEGYVGGRFLTIALNVCIQCQLKLGRVKKNKQKYRLQKYMQSHCVFHRKHIFIYL